MNHAVLLAHHFSSFFFKQWQKSAIFCARGKTLERKGEARRANVIIMPSKQRKKKRMKTSLAAFDDDESDEHEKNDARDDATDADDALCPGPKKLIGDKRVRTRYMPSFVPKDAKKTTTIARRDACKTTAVFDAAEGADRGAGDDGAKNNGLWKQHQRRRIRYVSPQEEEEEEEDKEEKKRKKDERHLTRKGDDPSSLDERDREKPAIARRFRVFISKGKGTSATVRKESAGIIRSVWTVAALDKKERVQ